jgi:hypothetical protein
MLGALQYLEGELPIFGSIWQLKPCKYLEGDHLKIFVFCPNISAILGGERDNTCKEYAGIVGRIASIYGGILNINGSILAQFNIRPLIV